MASLPGWYNQQFFKDNGDVAANWRIYTYASGTTTQKDAYIDAAGVTPQTYTSDGLGGQYIALNARGELAAPLFLGTGAYDIVLKDDTGATEWTRYAVGAVTTSDIASYVLTADLANTSTASGKGADMVGYRGATLADWFFGPIPEGADPTGAVSSASAIATADTSATAAGRALVFPPGTYLIDSSYTFTSPVVMMPGAKLKTSASTVYLKFGAGFEAGFYYCLDTDGPTQFLKTEKIVVTWFGATGLVANDDTTGLTRAFRAARASVTSATSIPGSDYGARIVYFPSGVYRCNDVPVYCGTIVEGEWQGSLFGSTIQQISQLAPGLRIAPKNYSLTNSVLNNSIGQNIFRNIGFRSEVAASASEGLPIVYFMSPSQATTYLGIAGDTAGTVGHIDTFFEHCWFKDGNTCIMADDGMLWVHVIDCTFDVCRRAVQHKGTAKGRVNSRINIYYGMTWGALDNQSTEATLGVSWESIGDEFKAGNTSNATADYRRSLNYNPSVVVAGTSVRVKGSHFRRTDGLGTRIGGPIFIKNAEHVDLDVWMKDPDSTNDQKAIAIQDGVEHLRITGTILSESLASYANSRLVQISQSPQTLTDITLDLAIINTNASSVATGLHGNFVTTGVDVDRVQFSGNFTERIGVNISGRPRFVPTVASAAAVTLPTGSDVFSISGTTSITSIVATGWTGKTVTLVFQGILTVTDGSNLLLAGNFVTTADDSITLVCDGTNWREVARSVN